MARKLCLALLVSFSMAGWAYGGVLLNGGFDTPADPKGTDLPTSWDTFVTNDPLGWDGVEVPGGAAGGYPTESPAGGQCYGDLIADGMQSNATIGQWVENINRPEWEKEIFVSFYALTMDAPGAYVQVHVSQPSSGASWYSEQLYAYPSWQHREYTIPQGYGFVCEDILVEVTIQTASGAGMGVHGVWVDGIVVTDECTPEPASLCLFGLGVMALVRRRRR